MSNATCRGPECTRDAKAKGLCLGHYEQLRRSKELFVLGSRTRWKQRVFRDAEGRKQCTKCLQWKTDAEFHVRKDTMSGLASGCKVCEGRARSTSRLTLRYGLTRESFGELLARQGGGCAVCGATAPAAWHVDHDHSCCPTVDTCGRCIRGILCSRCNVALGFADDDIGRLLKMVEYLSRWEG